MNVASSKRVSCSYSANPKSAIQNQKWVGLFAIVVAFAVCGVRVEAQQPKKVPRLGFIGASSSSTAGPVARSIPARFA